MNLSTLCLEVIASNFEKIHSFYSSCDDPGLKRQLEFLQRGYSNEIAPKLFARFSRLEKVPEFFVHFIMNKHLKVLETNWLRDCSWETITEKFTVYGSNLEIIRFNSQNPWQYIMRLLSNLKEVTIVHHFCIDEILRSIATFCPNIVDLHLISCDRAINTGIKYLCMKKNEKMPCPKLKRLYIRGSRVKKKVIVHLVKHLRSLEETDYSAIPRALYVLHKNDLSALDKIEPYNFTHLNLLDLDDLPTFTEHLKICLTLCPRLKSLSCPILGGHLDLFSNLNELEKLHVKSPTDTYVNIQNLLNLKGKKLMSLTIDHSQPPVSAIVKTCPGLTFLQLNNDTFQNNSPISPFNTAQSVFSSALEEIVIKSFELYPSEWKADFLKCCEHCPVKKISFVESLFEMNFVKDILVTCHSLTCLNLMELFKINNDDKFELCEFAESLQNNPKINYKADNWLKYFDFVEFDINEDEWDDERLNHDDDDMDDNHHMEHDNMGDNEPIDPNVENLLFHFIDILGWGE